MKMFMDDAGQRRQKKMLEALWSAFAYCLKHHNEEVSAIKLGDGELKMTFAEQKKEEIIEDLDESVLKDVSEFEP